jgi:hypothetical protein
MRVMVFLWLIIEILGFMHINKRICAITAVMKI